MYSYLTEITKLGLMEVIAHRVGRVEPNGICG